MVDSEIVGHKALSQWRVSGVVKITVTLRKTWLQCCPRWTPYLAFTSHDAPFGGTLPGPITRQLFIVLNSCRWGYGVVAACRPATVLPISAKEKLEILIYPCKKASVVRRVRAQTPRRYEPTILL